MKSHMQKGEIFERLAKTLSEMLKIPKEGIKMNTTLIDDLGVDSLDLFDIVVRIGETFNLKISVEEELPRLETMVNIVEFIEDKLSRLGEE